MKKGNKMKKVVSFMKVLALLIVPVLLIASCNGKKDPTTSIPTDHVHSYTEEVIAPRMVTHYINVVVEIPIRILQLQSLAIALVLGK